MVAIRKFDTQRAAPVQPPLRIVDNPPADVPHPLVRADALPEHTDYRDSGCNLAPSCLRCPLARCQYDQPGGARRMNAQKRDREIAYLRTRWHAPITLLAQTYGLSRRRIFRILQEQRQASAEAPR